MQGEEEVGGAMAADEAPAPGRGLARQTGSGSGFKNLGTLLRRREQAGNWLVRVGDQRRSIGHRYAHPG